MENKQLDIEKFIANLEAKASYKNIKNGFKWENIPQFAVITGENGSGKTALLEQMNLIYSSDNQNSNQNRKYIFTNRINSKIRYFNNIILSDRAYSKNNVSLNIIKTMYRIATDFRQENNIFIIAQNYFKQQQNKDINLKDFINKNYSGFNENEQNILDSWRKSISSYFIKYQSFFKRHNMTEEKLLLEMTQDELDKWLDSIYDINIESKPTIFDEQLLMDIFGNYFIKFENYKRELEKQYKDKLVKEVYEIVETKIGKNPIDRINIILKKYYSKYELDIARNESNDIKLICRNKEIKNLVPLSDLSLGEQIIISLIMWQYENTTLNSTILLLDEPDAHLNPKMAKMLIDILKNVVVKEFDCQVIMTTHSLSSVAYCEDNDLFFMEDGNIRTIDKKEAIEKLSDGIMTFDNAMSVIAHIQKSNKPTLMVEGKLDKLHIENFYKLSKKEKEIPFEIIECGGVGNMNHFAIAFKQLKIPKENILFLCDYDKAGYNVNTQIIRQGYNTIYTLDIEHLNQDDDRIRLKNYPIEMLYPFNILKKNNLLEDLELKDFIDKLEKEKQKEKSNYFSADISMNDKKKYKLVDNDNLKYKFAKEVIDKLDINKDFEDIGNLIDRIEKILVKNT